MGLQYRRSTSVGNGRRLNVSKSGLSVSQRVGPLTLNSRGRGSFRVAPGLSFRFGRKNSGAAGLVMLALALAVFAVQAAFVVLRVLVVVAVWLARWAWFGASTLLERRRQRRAEVPGMPPATN